MAMGDDEYENVCAACDRVYTLGDGLEPTRWCNLCAQKIAEESAAEIASLRTALTIARKHIQAELERGYTLTYEPAAGSRWRTRHNDVLGKIEDALASGSDKD
jgi:hypothetical protein